MSLFFRLFAGIPMNEMDTFPLVPLGCWLFPIGVYLLMIGFQFGMDKQNRYFALVRYGWVQKWWKRYFLRNLWHGALAAVSLLVLFKIIDLFVIQKFTGNLNEILMIFVLWKVHAMTLSALFLLLENLKMKKLIPTVILLLEGLTFLSAFYFRKSAKYMFGTWGMYVQSDLYESMYGFSMVSVILVQVIIIAVCYRLGSYLLKGKEVEGV